MENRTFTFPPPRNYYANRKPSNINLDVNLKKKATAIAKHRYGYRLSELVNRLLEMEVNLRKGLLSPMGQSRHSK